PPPAPTTGSTTAGATTGTTTATTGTTNATTTGSATDGSITGGITFQTFTTPIPAATLAGFTVVSAGGGTSMISQQVMGTDPNPGDLINTIPVNISSASGGTFQFNLNSAAAAPITFALLGNQGQPGLKLDLSNDPGTAGTIGGTPSLTYTASITVPPGVAPGMYLLSIAPFTANGQITSSFLFGGAPEFLLFGLNIQ
nr:hypothetical protein [Armatimonadota bacterium]